MNSHLVRDIRRYILTKPELCDPELFRLLDQLKADVAANQADRDDAVNRARRSEGRARQLAEGIDALLVPYRDEL